MNPETGYANADLNDELIRLLGMVSASPPVAALTMAPSPKTVYSVGPQAGLYAMNRAERRMASRRGPQGVKAIRARLEDRERRARQGRAPQ